MYILVTLEIKFAIAAYSDDDCHISRQSITVYVLKVP